MAMDQRTKVVLGIIAAIVLLVVIFVMSSGEKKQKPAPSQLADQIDQVEDVVAELVKNREIAETDTLEFQKLNKLVEKYIIENRLIVYGGVALNNLLPADQQFYGPEDRPDYDVFSKNAKEDAIKFANMLHNKGYKYVQAQQGIRDDVYKVSADFQQLIDIHNLPPQIFDNVDTITGPKDMKFAGPIWLRIDLYKELAQSKGNVERWPKVFKRLRLISAAVPFKPADVQCPRTANAAKQVRDAFGIIFPYLRKERLPVVGASNAAMYTEIMADKKNMRTFPVDDLKGTPELYVLAERPQARAQELAQALTRGGIPSVSTVKMGVSYLVPEEDKQSYVVRADNETLVEFSKPVDCMTVVKLANNGLIVGTLQTMVSTLLNTYFAESATDDKRKSIICMTDYIISQMPGGVPAPDRLVSQAGCYGKPFSVVDQLRRRIDAARDKKPGRKFVYYPPGKS